MPNTSVSFTETCSNNSSIKKWKWFSSFIYIHSRFLVPFRLSYQQLLKSTCLPYKICYIKACVTATGFKSLIKKKNNFLTSWERSDKEFFSFLMFSIFLLLGFSESRLSRVQVFQVPGPGFRSSLIISPKHTWVILLNLTT